MDISKVLLAKMGLMNEIMSMWFLWTLKIIMVHGAIVVIQTIGVICGQPVVKQGLSSVDSVYPGVRGVQGLFHTIKPMLLQYIYFYFWLMVNYFSVCQANVEGILTH